MKHLLQLRTDAEIQECLGVLPDSIIIVCNGQTLNVFAEIGGETVHLERLRADSDGEARDAHGNAVSLGDLTDPPRRRRWGSVKVEIRGVFTNFIQKDTPEGWERVR